MSVAPRPTGRLLRRGVGLVVVAVFGGLAVGPVGAVGAVAVVVAVPVVQARRTAARNRDRLDVDAATVLELAARSVRAGSSVDEAVAEAARSTGGAGADLVVATLDRCRTPGGAWEVRPVRPPVPGPRRRARDLPAGGSTTDVVDAVLDLVVGGGGGARGLEAGATLLRERHATRVAIESGAGHARASARLLVVVPLVFALASLTVVPTSTGGDPTRPVVLGALVVGIGCEVVGALWTARLIRASRGGAG